MQRRPARRTSLPMMPPAMAALWDWDFVAVDAMKEERQDHK